MINEEKKREFIAHAEERFSASYMKDLEYWAAQMIAGGPLLFRTEALDFFREKYSKLDTEEAYLDWLKMMVGLRRYLTDRAPLYKHCNVNSILMLRAISTNLTKIGVPHEAWAGSVGDIFFGEPYVSLHVWITVFDTLIVDFALPKHEPSMEYGVFPSWGWKHGRRLRYKTFRPVPVENLILAERDLLLVEIGEVDTLPKNLFVEKPLFDE